MNGTTTIWSPASAAPRAQGGRFHLLFHDTHHRVGHAIRSRWPPRPRRLRRRAGVRRGAPGDLSQHGLGRSAPGPGTRPPTPRLFRPLPARPREGDLVWIGNWGDGERSVELGEFLLGRSASFACKAAIHGVRYPAEAKAAVDARRGRIRRLAAQPRGAPKPSPATRVTVHVPRRPYVELLPGIPTIRPFEALACGIPLVCSPWDDAEGLFRPGNDYLIARNGAEMTKHLRDVLNDLDLAAALAAQRLRDDPGPPHLRPPGRRTAGYLPRPHAGQPPAAGGPLMAGLKISFYGSSLVSAYWNGAATYYRGIIRALAARGHRSHLLRAGRLRPAEAPRHRRSGLGARRGLCQ